MNLELDGTTILTEDDLHDALDRALGFGPYYWRNLYAFRDRLNYDVERPLLIIWRNHKASRKAMGRKQFRMILTILGDVIDSDVEANVKPPFAYVLA